MQSMKDNSLMKRPHEPQQFLGRTVWVIDSVKWLLLVGKSCATQKLSVSAGDTVLNAEGKLNVLLGKFLTSVGL